MLRPTCRIVTLAAGLALAALACGEPAPEARRRKPAAETPAAEPGPPDAPPTAKLDVAQMLQEDLAAKRSPSDGGGRAWLEPTPEGPARVTAGSSARFRAGLRGGPSRHRDARRDLPAGVALLGLEHAAGRGRRCAGLHHARGQRQRHRAGCAHAGPAAARDRGRGPAARRRRARDASSTARARRAPPPIASPSEARASGSPSTATATASARSCPTRPRSTCWRASPPGSW